MRYKAFNSRYRLLAPSSELTRADDKIVEDCKTILQYATDLLAKREVSTFFILFACLLSYW